MGLLYLCCVESTWLTGAPTILVELDSVTIRAVRQETLIGATLRIKNRLHFFRTDVRNIETGIKEFGGGRVDCIQLP